MNEALCLNGHPLEWFNIALGHGWCKCLTCGDRTRADTPTLAARLWCRAYPDPNTGCWLWAGVTDRHGYGQIKDHGRTRHAYKVAYEVTVGPVPSGLQLDHLCRQRACIWPGHLEPVLSVVNIARGASPAGIALATGICQRGHELTPENVVAKAEGQRQCRKCFRIQNTAAVRRYRARRRNTHTHGDPS